MIENNCGKLQLFPCNNENCKRYETLKIKDVQSDGLGRTSLCLTSERTHWDKNKVDLHHVTEWYQTFKNVSTICYLFDKTLM